MQSRNHEGEIHRAQFCVAIVVCLSTPPSQAFNNKTGLIQTSIGGKGTSCIQHFWTSYFTFFFFCIEPALHYNMRETAECPTQSREKVELSCLNKDGLRSVIPTARCASGLWKVWWVRTSSQLCFHRIKLWVCPVWFEELNSLNSLICHHLQNLLSGQNKEPSRQHWGGIFLNYSYECGWCL